MVSQAIVVDERIIGGWKRIIGDGAVTIASRVFAEVTERQRQGIVAAAKQYGKFVGLPVFLKQV